MLTIIISIFIPLTLVFIFRYINAPHNPAVLGVYQKKNKSYYFKFLFMYVVLFVRQIKTRAKRAYAVDTGKSCDGTIHVHEEDNVLEQKYNLGDHSLAVDAVYFNGVDKFGAAVICGLARRQKHCDSFMYIKVGDDVLLSPKLPDTQLHQVDEESGDYKVEGIEISNIIPMRSWKLNYKGEMKSRKNPEIKLNVEADLIWSALWAPFNFDYQMSPSSMARDMARETWSKDYFKLLQKFHQTHYEQMGTLKGTVTIDGKEHTLKIPCVRDHSFGKYREWRNFHRYVLHFIFLENGDYMAIGVVSQPVILSHLTIGYLCKQSDQICKPVDSCDLKIYQHGENGVLPKDYSFTFFAYGQRFIVRVLVQDEVSFYIGERREALFYERWSTVEVNGIKGSSCAEWQYNNIQGILKGK